MKKLLAIALLSLAGLGLSSTRADAWGCWLQRHCSNKFAQHITCRQYNAFSPICWGNVTCTGCCAPGQGYGGGAWYAAGGVGLTGVNGQGVAFGQVPAVGPGAVLPPNAVPGSVTTLPPGVLPGTPSAGDPGAAPNLYYPTAAGQRPVIGPIPGKFKSESAQRQNAFSSGTDR